MFKNKKIDESGFGNWNTFFSLIKKCNLPWVWILIAFLCNFFYNKILLKLPSVTGGLMSGSIDSKVLYDAIWFYVIFTIALCADTALSSPARHIAAKNVRLVVWKKMLNIRMDYYEKNNPSELMSTITNDITEATKLLVSFLVGCLPTIYYAVSALKTISSYNIWLMVSTFLLLPVKIIYTIFVGRMHYSTQLGLYSKIGGLTSYLSERVRNLALIKTYTNERNELKKGEEVSYELFDAKMKVNKLQCIITALTTLIGMAQVMVIMVFGVVLLKRGDITIQQWVAFYMFSGTLSTSFDNLITYWTNLKSIQGTFARTANLFTAEEEEDNKNNTTCVCNADIVFDKVSFSYGNKKALQNISVKVSSGSSLAIIGLCGSGKTTMLSLLEHFYEPSSGEISLGGIPLKEFDLEKLRKMIGYVQQETDIFSGTVREALTYGIHKKINDEEIWNAANKTGFNEVLEKWEDGLDTFVAPSGTSMSGGQRQKLVLTREFLRNADIILMDEPTSALDATAAKMVQDTIFKMFPDKTKIIVTHDLSLLERVDKIAVLHNGVMSGYGSYDELYGKCEAFMNLINCYQAEKEALQW